MFEILLAEDNPGDVLLFREALASCHLPCNIVVAPDGQKAIELLMGADPHRPSPLDHFDPSQPIPDLIVLDVNLPKYNGDAVLRYVREQPWLSGVPVIMLTSSASPGDRTAAIELGADLFIQKSSDLDELLEVGRIVKALLANPRAPQA